MLKVTQSFLVLWGGGGSLCTTVTKLKTMDNPLKKAKNTAAFVS